MQHKGWSFYAMLSIIGGVCFIPSQSFVFAQGSISDPPFLTPGSNHYGKPYEEWASSWWQWHISLPSSVNPKNVDVHTCPVFTNGNVSFLDHSEEGKTEVTCNIPANTAVFTTILSGECDSDEMKTMAEAPILECAKEGGDFSESAIMLDNVQLKNYESRITTKFFNITIPEDNVYMVNPGTFKAVVDGYFLFLKPLPIGEHNLNIKVDVKDPSDPNFTSGYDATLKLIVN